MIYFWSLRSYIFIIHNLLVSKIGCTITLGRIMWGKISFTWIWTVIMDLGWHKVAPRGKNVNLAQVSSTKKTMFSIFQIFKILQISSYSEWTLIEKFLSLALAVFKNKTTNSEIFGIIWFRTIPGFCSCKFPQNLHLRHLISMFIFATKHWAWIYYHNNYFMHWWWNRSEKLSQKMFLNIYFWLVSYFMATLSINIREAKCFLIKTIYVIVFLLKKQGS